ncbi:dipeptidyl-peptidase III [Basidiobolus meristosporus CBS 931.73]|uniref:Dipeptidyl peptidase 3 n=1 Tax=Basidiobolus meristosporus CBS 931.73 TaxID=1314790 RepID=A0A1Y1YZC3_9FUNG|nr:dipeptidyl-peptidase III [Basidiobolus meristosporus CBS 931.73]|eukprot:ORY02915.1 dipeptidyl-peptidase III [Basidiobolus meristosporus CBS 931.73]
MAEIGGFSFPFDKQHYADREAPVCRLEIKRHFDLLQNSEKIYAHHISQASWLGARIILRQTTQESESIFDFIVALFKDQKSGQLIDLNELQQRSGVDKETFQHWLQYAGQFLTNLANYKSFGDTKFIPRIPEASLEAIVGARGVQRVTDLFNSVKDHLYSVTPISKNLLGYVDDGHISNYYSENVTKQDILEVQKYLESIDTDSLNTRLFKVSDTEFEVRVASASVKAPEIHQTKEGKTIRIVYGDYHTIMEKITAEILAAIPHAANDNQRLMLEKYAESFATGSIPAHKESQKHWIKDIGPTVESNIGFIETYRDPAGIRAEWEGFVAMVNKDRTKKFGVLVDNAEYFISKLPWGVDYEKDSFHKPDFTSLEVLSFATGGIPAGINIPNYDDIRESYGFKNVSLGNVLNAKSSTEKYPFLTESDRILYERLKGPSFEVQVGLHELLGHGSGKLLAEQEPGMFNFNTTAPPISPITKSPITTWYKPGETWGSVFKNIASSYEECRAESVALYLSTDKDALRVFGHTDCSHDKGLADDVMYIGWLSMVRAGLLGLEFYNPAARKWGQAHMMARYAILRVLLEAGQDFVRLERNSDDTDAVITLDRNKIMTVGMPAMHEFLQKLQVYKATADFEAGSAMYAEVTSVPDDWIPLRDIVLSHKQPRKLFVQANTVREGDSVILKEYPATIEGIIQSFVERSI